MRPKLGLDRGNGRGITGPDETAGPVEAQQRAAEIARGAADVHRSKESPAQTRDSDRAADPDPHPGRMDSTEDLTDEIRRRAWERYERRGGDHGHDLDDWLEAEREAREARADNPHGMREGVDRDHGATPRH